jgi:regulator of PEP synthase PpsR (kinase-PPPase family)
MVKAPKKTDHRKTAGATIPLYLLSDSTGSLARHMVTTFLTQFPRGAFELHLRPFIGEEGRLTRALNAISDRRGIVLHTAVSPKLKREIAKRCRAMGVRSYDLTGSIVDFLAEASNIKPLSDEQRLHPVDPVYCDRINAMTFTLEHDDGLGLETIHDADIVIAGVSRTGKTPTSIYLANLGFRVANVSLAMTVEPPRQLAKLPPGKMVGLIIDPTQLAEIRTRRQTGWGMSQTQYNDPREVAEEIDWSRLLFAKLHCPVLDVTDQAIEETAARLLDLLGLSQPPSHTMEGLS